MKWRFGLLDKLPNRRRDRSGASHGRVCFCTLAIHAPYRRRARLLCSDLPKAPWIVLTDAPDAFHDLPVRAIEHTPTGPMAADFLAESLPTRYGAESVAYHDKRFALLAALENFDTAIYVDADSRLNGFPLQIFPAGIAVLPDPRQSIAEHLFSIGSWRMPFFVELAQLLMGNAKLLRTAQWCQETLFAITRDGRESRFFEAWTTGADFLQARGVYSGEGGVIGLAAAYAGWTVDYRALTPIAGSVRHEGGGPKHK
jgi:hypothetical protein